MNDENYKKAEKLANIAEKILFISVILIISFFASLGNLSRIILLIAVPLYLTGLVIAIIAKDKCKECEKAKRVLDNYLDVTIALIVIITIFVILAVAICNSCANSFENAFNCDGCIDTCNKCPG